MTIPTTRLFTTRRAELLDWLRRRDPWPALSLLIVLVVALMGMWPRLPAAPPSVRQVTPAPVILVATPIPIVAPSAELRLVRAVVAYDAPDGQVLGATLPGPPWYLIPRREHHLMTCRL